MIQDSETKAETIDSSLYIEKSSLPLDRTSLKIALTSIFTALSIVVGYMLVFLPNIEIITLMIFLAGFIIGKKEGILVGAFSSFIFCFFNPMGSSNFPLLTVQVIYYSFVGLLGAITKYLIQNRKFFKPKEDLYVYQILVVFGIISVLLTTIFSIIIEIPGYLLFAGPGVPFLSYIMLGIPFSIIHVIGNLLGFAIILPGLIQLLYKLLD